MTQTKARIDFISTKLCKNAITVCKKKDDKWFPNTSTKIVGILGRFFHKYYSIRTIEKRNHYKIKRRREKKERE